MKVFFAVLVAIITLVYFLTTWQPAPTVTLVTVTIPADAITSAGSACW